jgi:ABC-type multidrug transport system fused ATPase/permease subunit
VLFAMTVSENIAYGLFNKDESETEIIEAAKAANAYDFIISLPEVTTSIQVKRVIRCDDEAEISKPPRLIY